MTIHIDIPSSWNDLSDRQLKKIAHYLHSYSKKHLDYLILLALFDLKFWKLKKVYKVVRIIKNVGITELKKHYSWLYEAMNRTRFIKKIKVENEILHAPADRLNDMTIDEFAHLDDLYLGFHRTKDIEYLYFLTAILYRELDVEGKRVSFDKTELEERAKAIRRIKSKTLLAILLCYQGSREYLINQFPFVFPNNPESNKKNKQTSGFGKLILHLSGGKFGTHNETKNTNVYTFLSDFSEQLKTKPYA